MVEKHRWENTLAEARNSVGMSQGALAAHIGRGQNTISAIERGVLSGREYMDELAEKLRVDDPAIIFPYYNYYTFEEAAERMGVSSTLIARRVDKDGVIPAERVGGIRLIPKAALQGKELRQRPGLSMRETVHRKLSTDDTGLTSDELLGLFAPFKNTDEEKRTKQTLQSILSRSRLDDPKTGPKEFAVDKTKMPPRWSLSTESRSRI